VEKTRSPFTHGCLKIVPVALPETHKQKRSRREGYQRRLKNYCQSELAKNRQGEAHLVAVRRLHAGAA